MPREQLFNVFNHGIKFVNFGIHNDYFLITYKKKKKFLIIQFLNSGLKETLIHLGTGILLFSMMYLIMFIGNKTLKKESLGGGDIKMMFLFGLVLDPLLGTLTIFLGSLFALPMSFLLMKTNNEKAIPFGPFLLIAFTFIYFTKMSSLDVLKFLGF